MDIDKIKECEGNLQKNMTEEIMLKLTAIAEELNCVMCSQFIDGTLSIVLK